MYLKDAQKTLFQVIWPKLLIFPFLWSLNQLLNEGLFNIDKMRGPNSYVVLRSSKFTNY